jgi:hypothetical protein
MEEPRVPQKFEGLTALIVYDALIHAIRTNSGIGFHNADQGHPAYLLGCEGKSDYHELGDSPEENKLYQLLIGLSESLGDSAQPPIRTWQDFCRLAVDSYKRSKETS